MTRLKAAVKQVDAVAVAVRCAREVNAVWRRSRSQVQAEKHEREQLRLRQSQIDRYLSSHTEIRKLQIGAGDNPLRGWLNTDVEPVTEDVVFLDALRRFPFDDQVFDYVFSEHMIEHVPYKGGLSLLREAFRVMKSKGRIRIATPDARKIVGLLGDRKTDAQKQYIRWSSEESIGLYSPQLSRLQQRREEWAIDHDHIRTFYPDANEDCACFIVNNFFRSYGHQFLYDSRTLTRALESAGFVEIRESEPGRSPDPQLNDIESHGRVIGEMNNRFETFVLEAVRP